MCYAAQNTDKQCVAALISETNLKTIVFINIRTFVFSCKLSVSIKAIHQPEVCDG